MSFQDKTDWIGLTDDAALSDCIKIRSNTDGASHQLITINGNDGSILGYEKFGNVKNPTCEYVITKKFNLSSIMLGKCYNDKYAVNSIAITTGPGQERILNATAVQVEVSSGTVCKYKCPAIEVGPERHALSVGLDYTESKDLTLQSLDLTIQADITPATVNGVPVASDAVAGVAVANATFWATNDSTAPSVSVQNGWNTTTDWACTGGDSAMPTWSLTISKPLSVEPTT